MPLTRTFRNLGLAFLVAVAFTLIPTAANAKTSADQYCNVLVGASANGANSPVLTSACGSTAQEALSAYQQKVAKTRSNAVVSNASSSVPIAILYTGTYYTGSYTNIWGDSGPCDTSGYNINMYNWSDYWAHNTSSIKGLNSCNDATMGTVYNGADDYITVCLPEPTIGVWDNYLITLHVKFYAGEKSSRPARPTLAGQV